MLTVYTQRKKVMDIICMVYALLFSNMTEYCNQMRGKTFDIKWAYAAFGLTVLYFLALYLFTQDKREAESVLSRTRSGGACINDTISHLAAPTLPFGGVGASGMGSYHGKYGFLCFSHERAVLTRSAKVRLPFAYPPYSRKKMSVIEKFLR